MTAHGSSSSVTSPSEVGPDLAVAGLLAPLPRAFLEGRDVDLLAPLRFLPAGELPAGSPPPTDRRELAAALAVANVSYGHPAADRLAARLADPAARVVVTGQQPGLFGGPLYTLSKAVAASRLAARLEERGEPAVAVFWVATEDHDWSESSSAAFLTSEGPRSFDLGEDPAPLLPVGMRSFGPRVSEVLAEIAAGVPGERFAAWLGQLARWYRPDARFGEAFCRLLAHLLGERCPLLLDAMLPAVKEAERAHLARLVEARRELAAAYEEADRQIAERGFPLQVHPQPGASPLFLLHGRERRRIRWCDGDRFSLRGAPRGQEPARSNSERGEEPARSTGAGGQGPARSTEDDCDRDVASLLQTIAENPAVVSPGVLARPALQDALLGTWVQVLGGGELSYMPQVAPAYRALGVPGPWVALRPQALVLEEHQLEKLGELGLTLDELVDPEADLDRLLARRLDGGFTGQARERIAAVVAELREPALSVDPSLEKPWEKTLEQVVKALDVFSGKVDAALARRDQLARQRAVSLRDTCRPLGDLQERVISTAHFPGKHAERFVAALWDQLGSDPRRLQLIRVGG